LSASSEEDPLAINEILGGEVGFGVPSVTSTLIEGEQLEISGLSEVTFTPAETELRSTLTAGDWVVGLDIAAGDYVATPADGETGNFVVYDDWGLPATNEILGEDDGFSVPEVTVSLADGDEIEISGLSEVTFTSKYPPLSQVVLPGVRYGAPLAGRPGWPGCARTGRPSPAYESPIHR